jgi:hypothetical protein
MIFGALGKSDDGVCCPAATSEYSCSRLFPENLLGPKPESCAQYFLGAWSEISLRTGDGDHWPSGKMPDRRDGCKDHHHAKNPCKCRENKTRIHDQRRAELYDLGGIITGTGHIAAIPNLIWI